MVNVNGKKLSYLIQSTLCKDVNYLFKLLDEIALCNGLQFGFKVLHVSIEDNGSYIFSVLLSGHDWNTW